MKARNRQQVTCGTLLVLGALAMGAGPAQAQLENLRFNFLPPGARSLALGGAFLGLADDATAAYTNPAGLSNLSVGGPEVAVEFRGWRYRNNFLAGQGSLAETPTGIGVDTHQGIQPVTGRSETQGLSFLSVGYVFPRGWTMAAYRHELANFRLDLLSQGLFFVDADDLEDLEPGDDLPLRFPPSQAQGSARIVNSGISVSYQLPSPLVARLEDSLSIGIGWARSEAEVEAVVRLYDYSAYTGIRDVDRRPGNVFGPADLTPDRLVARNETLGTAVDDAFNVGFLWKLGRDQRWSLGGAYRKGPSFSIGFRSISGPANLEEPVGTPTTGEPQVFRVPDSYGLGISYSAAEGRTKLALDYDRVLYSQGLSATAGANRNLSSFYEQKDIDEIHLGAEHVFLVVESLFVATARAGVWYEPGHDVDIVGARGTPLQTSSKDQIHWSAGLGLVVKEDFQIDVGADLSDPVKTVSLSLVKFL